MEGDTAPTAFPSHSEFLAPLSEEAVDGSAHGSSRPARRRRIVDVFAIKLLAVAVAAAGAVWLLRLRPLPWPALTAVAVVTAGASLRSHDRQRAVLLQLGRFIVLMDEIKRLYLVSRRPCRIILLRHGESEGNADRNVYRTVPDHALKLTALGEQQAQAAGERLREVIGDESCFFYISPYTRCRQTYQIVRDTLKPSRYVTKEDPRLREQDFGHFQDPEEMRLFMAERNRFGRFWYRFPFGESGADVFDRASAFWDTLFRSMELPALRGGAEDLYENYIIVTHGLMMRLFLMRYFQWTVEDFHLVYNPGNCEIIVLELQGNGAYKLATESVLQEPSEAEHAGMEELPKCDSSGSGHSRPATLLWPIRPGEDEASGGGKGARIGVGKGHDRSSSGSSSASEMHPFWKGGLALRNGNKSGGTGKGTGGEVPVVRKSSLMFR